MELIMRKPGHPHKIIQPVASVQRFATNAKPPTTPPVTTGLTDMEVDPIPCMSAPAAEQQTMVVPMETISPGTSDTLGNLTLDFNTIEIGGITHFLQDDFNGHVNDFINQISFKNISTRM